MGVLDLWGSGFVGGGGGGSGFIGVLNLWGLSCYTVDLSSWRNKLDEATPYSEEATPLGATHTHTDYDNCSSEEDEVEHRPTVADSKYVTAT